MVGEDVAQRPADGGCEARAPLDAPNGSGPRGSCSSDSPPRRADAPGQRPGGDEPAVAVDPQRQLWQRARRRPEDRLGRRARRRTSSSGRGRRAPAAPRTWPARAGSGRARSAQPAWVQIFEKARMPSGAQPRRRGGRRSSSTRTRTTTRGAARSRFDAPCGEGREERPDLEVGGDGSRLRARRRARRRDAMGSGARASSTPGPSEASGVSAAAPSGAPGDAAGDQQPPAIERLRALGEQLLDLGARLPGRRARAAPRPLAPAAPARGRRRRARARAAQGEREAEAEQRSARRSRGRRRRTRAPAAPGAEQCREHDRLGAAAGRRLRQHARPAPRGTAPDRDGADEQRRSPRTPAPALAGWPSRVLAPLAEHARDHEQRGRADEPGDHALGHGADVADAPAAAVVRVPGGVDVAGDGRTPWRRRSGALE